MNSLVNLGTLHRAIPQWSEFFEQYAYLAEPQHWLNNHGDAKRWFSALEALEHVDSGYVDASESAVSIAGKQNIEAPLQQLIPWRKGPYQLHQVFIDSEWRSDFKWDRLVPHLGNLHNKKILDVGCGNGYHLWRAKAAGAAFAMGVDPSLLFLCQFNAVAILSHNAERIALLPIGCQLLPDVPAFDQVWSMGVIYHRRDPLLHINQLLNTLNDGGDLVLESIVIPSTEAVALRPEGRYAQMRNVWQIPSANLMCEWLRQSGLKNVRIVDQGITELSEQRQSPWMPFESLQDHLDPFDRRLTREGHPAPRRAICIGTK